MRPRNLLSFIAFGLMIVFVVGYIGSLGVRVSPPSDRTNLSMTVADINSLAIDSNVLLRGVPVGKVTNIATSINGATIDFYVDGHFRIPVDCEVRLDNLSALGETYIGLRPRSQGGPTLRDGQHFGTESVIQPPSISELAVSVGRVLSQLDPGAIQRILAEGDSALPNPNSVLPNLSHASELLRNTAANMHGYGRVLLSNFQTLLHNAGWVGPTLAGTIPGIRSVTDGVQKDVNGVGAAVQSGGPEGLYKFDSLLARIQKLLNNNGGDLKVLGEAFQPKVKGIAGALLTFDPSQIMSNIVNTLPEDGAVTLHVTIPEN